MNKAEHNALKIALVYIYAVILLYVVGRVIFDLRHSIIPSQSQLVRMPILD